MRFTFTPEQEAFRMEVNDFLRTNLPANWEGADNAIDEGDYEFGRQFLKKLAPKKWIAPAWPVEYGGLGMSLWDQVIFNEAMGYARAPIVNTAAVGYLGPTIILYGSDEQKQQHLPGITSGDVIWCQGYSEPNSGSDLASLQTKAVKDGDDWIINGQKIWTSQGHYADWMFLIARTDPDAPKHRGISYFLLDMKDPGVSVRPLMTMAGSAIFNEVFFENVRVPARNRIGEENRGWYIGTTTLDFERSSIGSSVGIRKSIESMIKFAKDNPSIAVGAKKREVQLAFADRMIEAQVAKLMSYRVVSMQNAGLVPNHEASMCKLFGSEMQQRIAALGVKLNGMYSQIIGGSPEFSKAGRFGIGHVAAVSSTIAGGTSEIQRNIMAQRGLGLPRD